MTDRTDRISEILDTVLQLTELQSSHLSDNNLEDLLRTQQQREGLLAEISRLDPETFKEGPAREVIAKILDNDRCLALNIETSLTDIKGRLEKIRKGSEAMKAYSG